MAKLSRKRGTTSQILHIFIQDSSATTGAGLAGLLYNSASLVCRYINAGGTLSGAITLQDITALGTYEAPTLNTNMRFKEVSSASPSQGIYEIHVHNDWMNLTGGSLVIMLAGATNMAQFRLEIDLQADVNVTQVAGTAQTAGDLAALITTVDTVVDVIAVDVAGLDGAAMRGTDSAYTGTPPTAAFIADAVWDEAATGHVDAGKAGEQLWTDMDAILVDTIEIGVAGASLTNINLPDQTMNITGNITGNLSGSVGSLGTTAKADVNAEVDAALADINLDHIAGTATGIPAIVAGTYIDQMMDDGTATYDRTTDSLQAIRDTAPLGTVMRGTDSAALASVCTETRLAELDAANLPTDVANVKTDTAAVLLDTGTDGVVVNTHTATGKAEINAEVVDVVATDTIAELAQGIPAATPTIRAALMLLYMGWRNKLDVDANNKEVHNDAGTVICKKALTDDGTTYSEAEMVSGP